MLNRLDEHAVKAVELARLEAHDRCFSHVGSESILVGVLREAQLRGIGGGDPWGLSVAAVRAQVARRVGSSPEPVAEPEAIPLTPRAQEVLAAAGQQARRQGRDSVSAEDLLMALLEVGEGEGVIALEALKVSTDALKRLVDRPRPGP